MTPWKSKNPQTGRINKPNVPGRTNKKQAVEKHMLFYALECRPIDLLKGRFKQNKPKQNKSRKLKSWLKNVSH
jgi:hypothetical protein